jgi:hypothetical protein
MDERTALRQTRWLLGVTTLLFAGFAWATTQAVGFGPEVMGLALVALASLLILLWLTFRWKVATVIAVTMAILAGGAIGARMETRQEVLACTRGTIECEQAWNLYYYQLALWMNRNVRYQNCLLSINLSGGAPNWYYCYVYYYPGPKPKPPA